MTFAVFRDYASGVDLRLKSRSMLTVINILPSEEYLQRATDDVIRRGLPYNIIITAQNELHRSITLKILHGTPQGKAKCLVSLTRVYLLRLTQIVLSSSLLFCALVLYCLQIRFWYSVTRRILKHTRGTE